MINFKVQELVSPEVYKLLGDEAIKLLDTDLLGAVDKLVSDMKADGIAKGCVVNDWLWGGNFTQSGYREVGSSVGAPGSMHKQGKALDLKFNGCSNKEAMEYLLDNQDKYPAIRRVEDLSVATSWLHVDTKSTVKSKIHVFMP